MKANMPSFAIMMLFAAVLTQQVAEASSPPAGSVRFYPPVDPEQLQSDDPRPAGKWAADLNVGDPRTVRLFYLLPNDRTERTEVVDSMKAGILDLQTFFANQMEAHGHGRKTFQFEADDQGDPVVHRVNGQRPSNSYLNPDLALDPINESYDNSKSTSLIVIDRGRHGNSVSGTSWSNGKRGGFAIVSGGWSWVVAAHELAHTFGLQHDFRDDTYILSYGRPSRPTARMSACAAGYLTVHPYFNPDLSLEEGQNPTIELTSPSEYRQGADNMPLRLKVRDSDGLHQVFLLVLPNNPFLGSSPEVKECRTLAGETDTVIEFNFDGTLPSDRIGTPIDQHRNLSNAPRHNIVFAAVDMQGDNLNLNNSPGLTSVYQSSPYYITTLNTGNLRSISLSPDATTLAVIELNDETIKLWDVATRTNTATLQGHTSSVQSVAFSPDGAIIATGSGDRTIKLWDVATQTNAATLQGHTGSVHSVAFSRDGTTLASGSYDGTIKLWDVATRTNTATLQGRPSTIIPVAFSPDGSTLAYSFADETVKLWDVSARTSTATLQGHASSVRSVAFSSDGTTVASGSYDGTIKLWDLSTQTNTATLRGHSSSVGSVAFSPDGKTLASGSNKSTVKLWNVAMRSEITTLQGYPEYGRVYSVAFSADGSILASGGEDRKIRLWDVSEWAAPLTPISDRTPQVREAILGVVRLDDSNVTSFAGVTRAHLAAITELNLRSRSITALRVGDFDGLTALTKLYLNGNQLTSLPEGLFNGQPALKVLALGGNNQLSSLPAGIFSGLSALTELYLGDNGLTTLPEGIFRGLSSLRKLVLSHNRLVSLPTDAFRGLSALTELWVYNNRLTSLPAGAFSEVSALTRLGLWGNAVDPLPLTISLEKVADGQFRAVVPTGAPFEIVLPLSIANGSIEGGATTITIAAGSVESEALTVTRSAGTTGAVTVWIGPVPNLPANHSGYRLDKSTGRFRRLEIFEDASIQIWSGTITVGSWGNAFGNRNATGFGYSRRDNAGSISPPTVTYKGTTYTINGFGFSRIGNNSTVRYVLTISPGFPPCDKKLLTFGSLRFADALDGGAYGSATYNWHGRSAIGARIGQQWSFSITLHPTVPDAPVVTAIDEGNQVRLHWTTPCDGGIDVTGHEYREKAGNGSFGSWMPIPNSAAGEVNAASYTVTGLNTPSTHTFEVRAANRLGEGENSAEAMVSSLPAVPLGERTPQVRDAITAAVPGVSDYTIVNEAHLATITQLRLGFQNIAALKPGDFSGLSGLMRLNLPGNQLSSLPDSVFAGLTSLAELRLGGNPVDPLPLTVTLEKVGSNQFKAVAPTGAPFEIVLPVTITNGSISGGVTTTTIPKGSFESQPLTVTRTSGTTLAVTADIGTLPGLPRNHYGYALVKSSDLPLEVFGSGETGTATAATDFNGDGRTDFADFFLFADAYGGTDSRFDLDRSGRVDFADFFRFVDAFGT